MPQNLISDKYYDLWLSIDTKNSPLSGILLLLQAAELRRSKMKIFKQKKSKFQILSYRRDIYPKRKLRTSTIQIQPEKVWIFAKKKYFFQFFWFSRHARGPPEIFDVHFFESFKKNSKNGFTGSYQTLKGTKSWILVNLAQILWKRQTIFNCPGTICPHSGGIGLSEFRSFNFDLSYFLCP